MIERLSKRWEDIFSIVAVGIFYAVLGVGIFLNYQWAKSQNATFVAPRAGQPMAQSIETTAVSSHVLEQRLEAIAAKKEAIEQARLAKIRAEEEEKRLAAERERLAKEKAEQERRARLEAERLAKERAEQEEKAAAEQAAKEKAEKAAAEKEKAAKAAAAKKKAEKAAAAKEKAAKAAAAKKKAEKAAAAKEKAAKAAAAKKKAEKAAAAKEKAAKAAAAKEKAAKAATAKKKAATAKKKAAAAKEKAAKAAAAKEKAAKAKAAREARELEAKLAALGAPEGLGNGLASFDEQAFAAAKSEAVELFGDAVKARMKRFWQLPPNIPTNLSAQLLLRIDQHGKVVHVEVNRSSGYPLFDTAAMSAAKAASPLPLPNFDDLTAELVRDGVLINFSP
ncbi:TonB family protein [Dichelobacter nodosus]|uniref:TolA protein n=1 Tax=Dichelobacter nodosus (strain VCS1703A) TaxID=246195 RepID=A5EXH3_DICNV|nr:TonB family protein [Dichelobacter nodosus]ABQ13251.1 TolA protein [Dichelobacter nodosus VCS1703A]